MSETNTASIVAKLRGQIETFTNGEQSNSQIAKEAVQQIANDTLARRVKVLVAAIKQLERYETSLAKIEKPDSLFYQASPGGKFTAFPLYSAKLVEQIERDRKTIIDLAAVAEKATKPEATAADHEELENLLRPLNIL